MKLIRKIPRPLPTRVPIILAILGLMAVSDPVTPAGGVDTFYDVLNAVTCSSTSSCFAVGYQEIGMSAFTAVPLIEHWDGTAWRISPNPPIDLANEGPGLCQFDDSDGLEYPCGSLASVSCSGPSTCFAVGSAARGNKQYPLIERWDGRSWSVAELVTALPSGSLTSVSCSRGERTCMAVGYAGDLLGTPGVGRALIMHWTGSTWWTTEPASFGVDAVACPGPSSCFAVGQGAHDVLAAHWNGRSWSVMPNPKVKIGGALTAIACPGGSSCFAIGGDAPLSSNSGCLVGAVIDHWNGARWSVMPHPRLSEPCNPGFSDYYLVAALLSVSCAGPNTCFTAGVGDAGSIGWQWNGSVWTSRSDFGGPESLGCSRSQCMAVGAQGTCCFQGDTATAIQRWNGRRWYSVPSPNSPSKVRALNAIDCFSTTTCVAVGALNQTSSVKIVPFVDAGSGTHWVASRAPAPLPRPGTVPQVDDELLGVSCAGPRDCEAVGDENGGGGLVEHWNGVSWSAQPSPEPDLRSVSCPAPSDCFFGSGLEESAEPMVVHWNGHAWTTSLTPSGGFSGSVVGISCLSRSSCMGVGIGHSRKWANVLFAEEWNGQSWDRLPMAGPPSRGESVELGAVDCTSPGSCLVVGYDDDSKSPMAERWNGSRWVLDSPSGVVNLTGGASGNLAGVSCINATTCFAVGYFDVEDQFSGGAYPSRALVERWNGKTWTLDTAAEPSAPIENSQLTGISCTHAVCYAVGSYDSPAGQFPLIERWRYGLWTIVSAGGS